MKKLLLSLVVLMSSTVAMAQIDLGIKAGANLDFNKITLETFDDLSFDNPATAGFHAGLQLRLNTKLGLYVQGDAIYNFSSTKANFKLEDVENLLYKSHSIDIPVVVGFKFAFLRVYAGPKFNLGISHSAEMGGHDADFSYDQNVMNYQAGIGLDLLGKITLDVNYNGAFGKSTQTFELEGVGQSLITKSSANQVWLSVGFLF